MFIASVFDYAYDKYFRSLRLLEFSLISMIIICECFAKLILVECSIYIICSHVVLRINVCRLHFVPNFYVGSDSYRVVILLNMVSELHQEFLS